MDNITSTNIHSFCRICLDKLQNYGSTLNMMECMYNVHENQELSHWIAKCLQVPPSKDNDYLPNFVCTECYQKLQCFYEFCEISTRSMQTLWEILGLPENREEKQALNWLGMSTNEDEVKHTMLSDANDSATDNQALDDKNLVMRTIMEYGQFEPEINIEEQTSPFAHCAEMPKVDVDTLAISSNKTTKKDLEKCPQYISSKLQCKECKRNYANQDNLDAHMRSHQGLRPFQCQKCDSSFKRMYHLRRHVGRLHSESVQKEGTEQGPEKDKIKEINAREDNVAGVDGADDDDDDDDDDDSKDDDYIAAGDVGDEYKGNDSDSTEESNYSNEQHTSKTKKAKCTSKIKTEKKKYTATKFIYQCKECNRSYASEEALVGHMRTHQGLLPFVCTKCSKCFKRLCRLRAHMISTHNETSQEFTCTVEGCGKTFRLQTTYRTHYRTKHIENASQSNSYMCEDCGRVFKRSTALRRHRYTHGPREEYPHHCEQCGKRYSTLWAYKQHQMRHKGIKRFVCPYCGLRKTTTSELKTHINYHTKEKQWPCSVCPRVFNSSSGLKTHTNSVHFGLRMHMCSYCNESFAKLRTLRHHEMRHTGERPHECHTCHKGFIQLVALKTHIKKHPKCGINPDLPAQTQEQVPEVPQEQELQIPQEQEPQILQLQPQE